MVAPMVGRAPGRANTGDKMMTLVASALAGGDCIDDADVLRTGGTACTLGSVVKAPSTLGTKMAWKTIRRCDDSGPRSRAQEGGAILAAPLEACVGWPFNRGPYSPKEL